MPEQAASPAHRARLGGPQVRIVAILAGLALFVAVLAAPPPAGLAEPAWRVAAVAALMATWWIFGAAPIAVTALLPIALFPLLGVASVGATTAPYANPLIFLFMGGFMLALAVERWNLHRRIALTVLRLFGTNPARLIGGFMVATAALSMWVSNTATTIMMLPVALSVIALLRDTAETADTVTQDRNFAVGLLLGTAYAASVGGIATLVGTPPNALLAAYMAEVHGRAVGFAQWMLVGLPLTLILLPATWFVLTRVVYPTGHAAIPGARRLIADRLAELGPVSRQEAAVAVVFALTAAAWIGRPFLNGLFPGEPLSDAGIAIAGAILLFLVPADFFRGEFLMNWDWAKRVPWEILILFGGGLTLASAINSSGLAAWIGVALARIEDWPTFLILAAVVATVIFLTEITSNTATTAVFLPVVGAVALTFGADPMRFAAAAALAASCAFMMPVATPPNAIVFGSGELTIPMMAKAGLVLNLIAIGVISIAAYTLIGWVFAT